MFAFAEKQRPIFSTWYIAALLPVLGVITGFLGSIFSSDILESFVSITNPFTNFDQVLWGPTFFWICLIFFAYILAMQQYAVNTQRSEDQNQLEGNIRQLEYTLSTMPPSTFLAALSGSLNACDKLITESEAYAEEEHESTNLTDLVRYVLDSMVALAEHWDKGIHEPDGEAVYRANIMWFYPIEKLSDDMGNNIYQRTKFLVSPNKEAAFLSIDGFLDVDLELTSSTKTKEFDKDPDIKPFSLPVTWPENAKKGKTVQNLPGAPAALVSEEPHWIGDTNEVADQCSQMAGFDKKTISEIKDYYANDEKGRSIISWPIINVEGHPIGAINIYRNKTRIGKNHENALLFVGIMLPFTLLIRDLLADIVSERQH